MSNLYNTNRNTNGQSIDSINSSTSSKLNIGDQVEDNENESTTTSLKSDSNSFIGKEKFLEQFNQQLKQFDEWNRKRDWLAFHHHHYDWWMFPIDEISSRGSTYQLPHDVIDDLKYNQEFIANLRRGVRLMVRSWGWDIDNNKEFSKLDDKQKWSYWPVRLYKAGKCMWLFGQYDYYDSLKQLAYHIIEKEKLDFFSHTKNGKANVLDQWIEMEQSKVF